ncbi:hypothetical protein NEOKW01_1299 [Nematocida sp. AWRm80]|nr:hypothetical protein NEOKW01_1299 [Nematocida sp. AWRm80]
MEQPEKRKIKEGKEGQAKKEREKPYTIKDFIESPYGLSLLSQVEPLFKQKMHIPEESMESTAKYYNYARNVCKLYLSWAQASPLCGNKRNKMYQILRRAEDEAIEQAKINQKLLKNSGETTEDRNELKNTAEREGKERRGNRYSRENRNDNRTERTQKNKQDSLDINSSLAQILNNSLLDDEYTLETTVNDNYTETMGTDIDTLIDMLSDSSEDITDRKKDLRNR